MPDTSGSGNLLGAFEGLPVAVVGDVMLDHFLVGHVDRISPEAPVPVVRFARDDYRLGGAANVALNVASLGGAASLIGATGQDDAADRLAAALDAAGIDRRGLVADAGRPTTRKVRIVTLRNQQVARVDYEDDGDVSGAALGALTGHIRDAGPRARAIVLSDYRKGVVIPAVIAAAREAANAAGVPLLVDPKVPRPDRYQGVSVLTPNHGEAEAMTQTALRTEDDVRDAARTLHTRTGASIVITRGEAGMWVLDATGAATVERALPAAAREVADVTGAGDTVIAVIAMGLAAGAPLVEAAALATAAAGLVVTRFGPAAPTRAQLAAALDGATS